MRVIFPEAWWDRVFDRNEHLICLDDIHTNLTLSSFRAACYRQAEKRRLKASVTVTDASGRFATVRASDLPAATTQRTLDSDLLAEILRPTYKPAFGSTDVDEDAATWASRCTCENTDKHDPSCGVWG